MDQECRTCLGQFYSSDLLSVQTKVFDQDNVLVAIKQIASIEVSDNDTFPKFICHSCFSCLVSALSFRKQTILSHIELKKRQEFDPLSLTDNKIETDRLDDNEERNCADESDSDWKSSEIEEKFVKRLKRKPTTRIRKKRKIRRPPTPDTSETDSEEPIKIRKKSVDGPRLCPICGKMFKSRQNFNSHMTTVHRKRSEKPDKISCLCPDCGRVITGTRQNFVAHRRYHHSDKAQVKKRFTCDLCPRKFYREKNLIIHQRIHKGEKGYVCELCPDKSYTQIGGLILHRRKIHLKKPTCTCNYCGKQFYEKHYLETHIRQWHTGERPFSCEICGKAFSCNGTLLRHRKDSHGEKKACPKCGKMYTEGELRKHLKRHKIREEGIKRKKYTCEYCGTEMNFTSRKRHLLKQHGIMLRGRGETAERVPITRADAM